MSRIDDSPVGMKLLAAEFLRDLPTTFSAERPRSANGFRRLTGIMQDLCGYPLCTGSPHTRRAPRRLTGYFQFYNGRRRHSSLGRQTPDVVYFGATGFGTAA